MSLAIDWFGVRKGEDPMRYLDDVYRYAAVRLNQREDAEDIAIEVVQALPNPCSKSNLKVYMLGMARRKIADKLRKVRPEVVIRELELTHRFDQSFVESQLVSQTFERLSAEHREALTLKYIVGLSSIEIGQVLGKRPPAVDSLLQRARESFGKSWGDLSSDEVKQ